MEPAAHETRLVVGRVHGAADLVELVVERRVVGVDRRCEVGGEELELEPPVAAHDPEPPALPLRRLHSRSPVDLDPEHPRRQREPVARGDEGQRDACDTPRALLEQPGRIRRGEASDVDPGDPRPVREPVGRARVEERDDEGRGQEQQTDCAQPEARLRQGAATGADGGRGRCHGRGHGSRGLVRQNTNNSTPPETFSSIPVTYAARSEQRNAIAFAMSCGSPGRLKTVRFAMRSFIAAFAM